MHHTHEWTPIREDRNGQHSYFYKICHGCGERDVVLQDVFGNDPIEDMIRIIHEMNTEQLLRAKELLEEAINNRKTIL